MKIWKNITVSKASDGGLESKFPTHRLVVTDENYQNKVDVGSFWTRESNYGKFLSGKMGDARSYTNKEGVKVDVPGYVIVREDELNELLYGKQPTLAEVADAKENVNFTPSVNDPLEDMSF